MVALHKLDVLYANFVLVAIDSYIYCIDLGAAFDTFPHQIILQSLEHLIGRYIKKLKALIM